MLSSNHVFMIILGAAMIGTSRSNSELRTGHRNQYVVNVLHLIVLHNQLTVDWMLRLSSWMSNNHISSRILGLTERRRNTVLSFSATARVTSSFSEFSALHIYLSIHQFHSSDIRSQSCFWSALARDNTSIPSSKDSYSSTI